MDTSLMGRLGYVVEQVEALVAQLAAADDLVAELVAENDRLRARLSRVQASASRGRVA